MTIKFLSHNHLGVFGEKEKYGSVKLAQIGPWKEREREPMRDGGKNMQAGVFLRN